MNDMGGFVVNLLLGILFVAASLLAWHFHNQSQRYKSRWIADTAALGADLSAANRAALEASFEATAAKLAIQQLQQELEALRQTSSP